MVCFDDLALGVLKKLKLANLVAIPLVDFESKELLAVKQTRTAGEYCWTCTPHVIRYVLDTYNLAKVTYLDADLCFYQKPSILLDEFEQANASVLITEHRYTPVYDYSATSGIYCVQFMTFNADERGMKVLQWWQDRCLEWCYNRHEDGKFGDQKYLDDWPTRFECVHVLQHFGGGVAPWNIQQYKLDIDNNKLLVNGEQLVFYHFHAYKYYADGRHDFAPLYRLNNAVATLLYRPYGLALLKTYDEIAQIEPNFNRGWAKRDTSLLAKARYFKRMLKGIANEYRIV